MRNQPRTLHAIAFLTLAAATTAAADVVVLHPAQDNTLYEDGTGGTSNGAGQ
jgi:hypothetical protein